MKKFQLLLGYSFSPKGYSFSPKIFFHLLCYGLFILSLVGVSEELKAQNAYPNKPIRLIVPFAPGGTTDIVARIISERLGRELGQNVLVDNRPGGGGTLGTNMVAKSPADGYTLGMATVSAMATNPATNPSTPYDPIKDFTPIINLVNVPNVMTLNPSRVSAKNMAEFIALAKKNPNKYSYASSGTGGISHLDGELFKSITGTDIVHVPYKGSGPALNDLLAGQVDLQFDNLPSSKPHIQSGRIIALGIMAEQRDSDLSSVPTFAELGLKEVNNMAWYGLIAPAGLPSDLISRIHKATEISLKDPAIKKKLEESGSIIDGNSPESFAKKIQKELQIRKDVAQKQNIKIQE